MKVQIYFHVHLCLLLCIIPVYSFEKNITDQEIYEKMYIQQRLCGSVLADTMSALCIKYNGYRARRSITECCKNSCSYYYLMKYFCKEAVIPLDQLPSSLPSPTESRTESWPKVPQSPEHVSQSAENNESRQVSVRKKIIRQGKHLGKRKNHKKHVKCRCIPRRCKELLPNKIQKQPSSEELKHKPAEYGYVRSTRPPIIYRHSNTIARGVMTYEIPNQSNNSQQ